MGAEEVCVQQLDCLCRQDELPAFQNAVARRQQGDRCGEVELGTCKQLGEGGRRMMQEIEKGAEGETGGRLWGRRGGEIHL